MIKIDKDPDVSPAIVHEPLTPKDQERGAAAVEASLKVHWVRNLRIVDGSAIPASTPFLALPEVLMLAERAADLVGGVQGYAVADMPAGASLLAIARNAEVSPSGMAARAAPSSSE